MDSTDFGYLNHYFCEFLNYATCYLYMTVFNKEKIVMTTTKTSLLVSLIIIYSTQGYSAENNDKKTVSDCRTCFVSSCLWI